MNLLSKQSRNINPPCAACGDHKYFGALKKGICLQCWSYSALCNSIGFMKNMLKQGEQE